MQRLPENLADTLEPAHSLGYGRPDAFGHPLAGRAER
jgi:hypothetical protein